MKKYLLTIALMLFASNALAQTNFDIDLWPNGLPNSNGIDKTEPFDDAKRNFKPSVRVYLPAAEKSCGTAIVCCPGGAYGGLAIGHEGYDWAEYFNNQGIALIVLKYRMPHGHMQVPISDATEAIRLTREKAKEWNINPHKVGIMGSSAGGHLASTIATHAPAETRPDFQILFYPVISMKGELTHWGSRNNLLGEKPNYDQIKLYCNELQVSESTPKAIIFHSTGDGDVKVENSLRYYQALIDAGVNASLHIYPNGGHGWGFRENFTYHTDMTHALKTWLENL